MARPKNDVSTGSFRTQVYQTEAMGVSQNPLTVRVNPASRKRWAWAKNDSASVSTLRHKGYEFVRPEEVELLPPGSTMPNHKDFGRLDVEIGTYQNMEVVRYGDLIGMWITEARYLANMMEETSNTSGMTLGGSGALEAPPAESETVSLGDL
jgi:hypothetical protein